VGKVWNEATARRPTRVEERVMRIIHERCCGLDVHKRTVVACVLTPERRETRTFGTATEAGTAA
jgi:hypothetical protein